MGWYKPGRNPNHPGDPPPKWAPLSKRGRFALLVAVIAGIATALILMATTSAGATDDTIVVTASPDPLPPSWNDGQRVEVPDPGLAMTFPERWVIELLEGGSGPDFIILTQPERFGPEVELQRILAAKGPGHERDTSTFCTLVRYAPIDLTADEFLGEVFSQSDSWVIESLREGLSRVLVDPWFTGHILTRIPDAVYVDHYAIGTDSAVAVLMCYGVASHRDDWLAIAESFEFLPTEE